MSLPLRFGTTTATIPAKVPYIQVDPQKQDQWRQKLSHNGGRLKVGLCWSGRPKPRNRSIPPEMLSPLANIPGVVFYSLQRRDEDCPANDPPGLQLIDLSPQVCDCTAAALLSQLDLLITIDSAVAHLAGALGRSAWVLLQFAPDWRWMRGRSDCPWYPTLKLFRQPRPGDWRTPIAAVVEELHKLARKR